MPRGQSELVSTRTLFCSSDESPRSHWPASCVTGTVHAVSKFRGGGLQALLGPAAQGRRRGRLLAIPRLCAPAQASPPHGGSGGGGPAGPSPLGKSQGSSAAAPEISLGFLLIKQLLWCVHP